jgi:hypothetical protein
MASKIGPSLRSSTNSAAIGTTGLESEFVAAVGLLPVTSLDAQNWFFVSSVDVRNRDALLACGRAVIAK